MATGKTDVFVYIDGLDNKEPRLLGMLTANQSKGRKTLSFNFDAEWMNTQKPFFFDPDITWNSVPQFPVNKSIFGIFNDSMPDTWGRTLMKRREGQLAKEEKRPIKNLNEIDYLLGVNDESRMGA